MRVLSLLGLAGLLLQAGFVTAAESATMPTCGLLCTVKMVPQSPCESISNVTCICTNEETIAMISSCVYATCSTRDALTTKKFSDVTCKRPHADNSQQIIVTTPLFGVLALIIFLLRVVSRYVTGFKTSWGWDDWIMIPVIIGSIPMTAFSLVLAKHGLGQDMWMIDLDSITYILYIYYWDEILYNFVVPFTKISILAFYLRIFPRKGFRVMAWALIGANLAYCIAFELVTIFQCTPIDGAWLEWDGEYEATCRDVNLQAWVAAAASIVLDVATIAVPMPELWKLNMGLKKKIQVMLMFAVGSFVTVVSILRLQYLLIFAKTTNLTQDFVPVGVWSTVETSVGIICACMPAMRSLFVTVAPKLFGSTNRSSGYPTGNSSLSLSKTPKHIKVKSEFVLSSRTKNPDESSFMELTPFESEEERQHSRTRSRILQVESEDDNHTERKPTTVKEAV